MNDPGHRQGELVADHLRQIAPGQKLHRDEQDAGPVLTRLDDLHRVGMVQARRALDLALKPLHQLFVTHQVRMQNLDGHALAQRQLFGLVHVASRAAADQAIDPEVAGDNPSDERVVVLLISTFRRGHVTTHTNQNA